MTTAIIVTVVCVAAPLVIAGMLAGACRAPMIVVPAPIVHTQSAPSIPQPPRYGVDQLTTEDETTITVTYFDDTSAERMAGDIARSRMDRERNRQRDQRAIRERHFGLTPVQTTHHALAHRTKAELQACQVCKWHVAAKRTDPDPLDPRDAIATIVGLGSLFNRDGDLWARQPDGTDVQLTKGTSPMSIFTQQKFQTAVEHVRLRGAQVQEARNQGYAAWMAAMDDLMRAKATLDGVILAGLQLEPPLGPDGLVPGSLEALVANGTLIPVEAAPPNPDVTDGVRMLAVTPLTPNDVETGPHDTIEPHNLEGQPPTPAQEPS